MDVISESRLTAVHPVLSVRVHQLEIKLGFALRVTQGKRSTAEQDAIWSQGRFDLATVNGKRTQAGMSDITDEENKIVTHAPPGHSWHEYGLAVDVVPMVPFPDWDETHPQWKALIAHARDVNLLDGISFEDAPHLQPIELPVSPTPMYINLLMSKGTDAVWEAANITPLTVV